MTELGVFGSRVVDEEEGEEECQRGEEWIFKIRFECESFPGDLVGANLEKAAAQIFSFAEDEEQVQW